MSTLILVKQAAEIYQLGIKVERQRKKVKDYAEQYGLSSPLVYEQAQEFERLSSKFDELERRHIANTEKYMQKNK